MNSFLRDPYKQTNVLIHPLRYGIKILEVVF